MKPYYDHAGITIYHGDCREIISKLPKVALVLTDPPYGIDADNRKRILSRGTSSAKWKRGGTTDYGESKWDKVAPSTQWVETVIQCGNQGIVWGGNYFWLQPQRGWLVWDKLNTGDFAQCELAWTNLDQSVRLFRFLWNGFQRAGEAAGVVREHPTQKPVELMRWCLGFAPDAKTILDPFMGSGTTLRAAKDLGRRAIGIEIEERYCEIAARRMAQEVLAL